VTQWEGDAYQRRFDELAASGVDVHGEAAFVMRYGPATVLDAGCGTGRVAIELARRGVEVVGVDADASMLATARRTGSTVAWHLHDLTTLDLGRRFDVVVLAGNVPLFTPPGTERALVAGCARHVAPEGRLVAGFQLGRGYALDRYDADCSRAGLVLDERFSTWSGDPFAADGDYAVSVHRFVPR
jgi:2-polyprenyl-3-methyl-5-hydroxy-6-metoxy-1,4-benzoquinol methylase